MTAAMKEGARITRFVMGNVAGLSADKIWQYVKPLRTQQDGLVYVERYHWALACYTYHTVTGSPFAHGAAMSLFVLDAAEEYPFGIGDPDGNGLFNFMLGMALLGGWAVAEAIKQR